MQLERYPGNPILSPHPDHPWEDLAVFNPAAWYDERAREVILLYRAAESGPEYKCFFGLAKSADGCRFERVSDEPAVSPSGEGFDGATIQDPRMVKMGDWYYITYACRHFPFGQFWVPKEKQLYRRPEPPPEFPRYLRANATLTGLLLTKDFRTWIRAGPITDPLLDDRDVVLFPEKVGGKFVLIHRPLEWVGPRYGVREPSAWISFADDLLGFRESRLLLKGKHRWEPGKLGVNTPPLRTEHGWFTIYHAVGEDKFYRLGAVLLALDDPSVVLHRTAEPILEAEAPYEVEGYYRGVCFPCGAVVIDGRLFVYYGAGDKYCALATCDFESLLRHLRACPP